MRFSSLFVSLIFCTIGGAAASIDIAELLTELPSCSLNCIASGLSSSGIALTDIGKTCTNVTLQASLSACIQRQCNATNQFEVATVNQQLCKGVPFASRSWLISTSGLVLGPLALLAIALRCYSRLFITREFGYDDWAMALVAAFFAGLVALDVTNGMYGFGRHFWNLNPLHLPLLLKIFWIAEVDYILVSTLIRVSILLFYLRVFPARSFKIVSFIVMGLIVATGAATILTIIFQCNPISGVWDRTIKAKCININSLAYAVAGISIILDIAVLVLPVPQLLGLKTNMKKKISLVFMFGLGSLACVTSIVRLKYIVNFSNSVDQTWDNVLPSIWSLAEVAVAIICACLPAIRVLLTQWLPSVFDLNTHPRSDPSYKYGTKQNSSTSEPGFRQENMGPPHNRRVIQTPDEALLEHGDVGKDGRFITKIWVQPTKFEDTTNNHRLARQYSFTRSISSFRSKSSDSKLQNSHSTEMFALEGPRVSDEVNILTEEVRDALGKPTEWKGKDGEIMIVDTISVRSQRVPIEKSLPALPRQIIRSEWNEEN